MSEHVVKFPKIYKALDEPHRYKVLWGGRGAARSWTVARKLLIRGTQEKLLILCTRELQKSIKQSVHRLLKKQISLLKLDGYYSVNEASIKGQNGTEFIFMGVRHNPEEIKSTEGIDVCWIEEGENLTEGSWDILDPTIRNDNSEIWITFNNRFKFDYLYQLFVENEPPPGSLVLKANYKDNPFFPKVLQKQMEVLKERDYEKYLNIWEGEFKLLAEGAIYGHQITQAKRDNRILDFPITNSPVDTFWDLGKNNQTAIWFMQKVGQQYRFIDYFEARLQEIAFYCKVVKGQSLVTQIGDQSACKITEKVNERRRNYLYGTHYMPHDVKHNILGMDRTRKQQFERGGVKPIETVPVIKDLNEGIEMVRDIFPECYFHKTYCERGIEVLSNYRYKYNQDNDNYAQTPAHDWASNGADAFRQFAQGYKEDDVHIDHRERQEEHAGSWMA